MQREAIREIISRFPDNEGRVSGVLQEVQTRDGYISRESFDILCDELNMPPSKLYGVVTFFAEFTLKPRGKYTINVCHGTVCHVKGAARLTATLEKVLKVKVNDTSEDGLFTIRTPNCIGCCSLAPVMLVGETAHGWLNETEAIKIVEKIREDENNG